MKLYISQNLKHLRLQQNKSQGSFAKKFGLKQKTYAKYEEGINTPNIPTLVTISRKCKVDLTVLITMPIKKHLKQVAASIPPLRGAKGGVNREHQVKEHINGYHQDYTNSFKQKIAIYGK